jgi:peroxiredoxin
MSLRKGDKAPDFELEDQQGEKFKLSEKIGKKVLLIFHPLAWTSVCKNQMKYVESFIAKLESKNCLTAAISVDSIPSKTALAKELNLKKLKLLSDFWPHGEVARAYHVFREIEGFSERANFLIDEEGKIIFQEVYSLRELPDLNKILKIL